VVAATYLDGGAQPPALLLQGGLWRIEIGEEDATARLMRRRLVAADEAIARLCCMLHAACCMPHGPARCGLPYPRGNTRARPAKTRARVLIKSAGIRLGTHQAGHLMWGFMWGTGNYRPETRRKARVMADVVEFEPNLQSVGDLGVCGPHRTTPGRPHGRRADAPTMTVQAVTGEGRAQLHRHTTPSRAPYQRKGQQLPSGSAWGPQLRD
jgi:hypothetical protein